MSETATATDREPAAPYPDGLAPALRRLKRRLESAIAAMPAASRGVEERFRGMYITHAEAEHLLARGSGFEVRLEDREPEPEGSRLAWLERAFSLSWFDREVIVMALAPEIDLRFERLYAYIQDDVTRRRPTVDLALGLLCDSANDRIAQRSHFAPEAPLLADRLIHLVGDPSQIRPPLGAHYVVLDEQIVNLLLGQHVLDPRLAPFCQRIHPRTSGRAALSAELASLLPAIADSRAAGRALRVYFQGADGARNREAAEVLAADAGATLLVADLARALEDRAEFGAAVQLLFRQAWFDNAIVFADSLDALRAPDRASHYQQLLDALANDGGVTLLSGALPWLPSPRAALGVVTVSFGAAQFEERKLAWRLSLGEVVPEAEIEALAGRFQLTPSRIADAAATARNHALLRAAGGRSEPARPALDELLAAARTQSSQGLSALARKIEPHYHWDDIVLPKDALDQLREICEQAEYRHVVYEAWGFDRKLALGKNINVLFSGPPGTGKTMAADIIAGELGLDLYKIELAQVVSKYIGETEKNLDQIFTAAHMSNAILFFDEADTIFGKRSQVKDAHDRYANIEVGYLLQKMEEYDGVAILATNMRSNMDPAFTRRLKFGIDFTFPEEEQRRLIFQMHLPPEAPRSEDIDFVFLARQFKLSGGSIRNVVLNAAFLAAADHQPISMRHLILAVRREYQKLGKACSEAEFGEYFGIFGGERRAQ